jgi:hypothetical protein
MEEIINMTNINKNIITVRSEFIDLIGHLEKININYVNINNLIGFVYMDPKNEHTYKISRINNDNETYTFQYLKSNDDYEDIPHATFNPITLYDFDVDVDNKIFKKMDEFKTIDHIILNIKSIITNIQIPDYMAKKQSRNIIKRFFRKIFGC